VTKVGEQIAALREEVWRVQGYQLYQKDLAVHMGVTAQQVSNWELGRREVDSAELVTLVDVFSRLLGRRVSVDYILGLQEQMFAEEKDKETAPRMYPVGMTRKIPIFASIPLQAEPQRIGEEEVAVTELHECSGPMVFFLVVNNDDMAGVGIHKGHRVLIDPQAPVSDGDILLVAVAGEEYASLRQVYREGDNVLVLPKSPNGNATRKPSDVRVLGKVMWGRYYPNQQKG
jgi:SOS-response transcriptional repressor LexA